jgi:hypothetical protein
LSVREKVPSCRTSDPAKYDARERRGKHHIQLSRHPALCQLILGMYNTSIVFFPLKMGCMAYSSTKSISGNTMWFFS